MKLLLRTGAVFNAGSRILIIFRLKYFGAAKYVLAQMSRILKIGASWSVSARHTVEKD
jgi:hypothetical protein